MQVTLKRKEIYFETMTEEKIKELPLSKFRIFQVPAYIKEALREVKEELIAKGLLINPKLWLSDEWFCPDGTAGIGVPFYLVSDKLIEIEKREVGFVEGETKESAKKMLRHEIGHVVDNLFNLRRNRKRQQVFGKSSIRYPSRYFYKPYSKNFVKHMGEGYAQCHPAEDFAETFAVWLNPKSDWQRKYQGWGCLKKLLFMDELMEELRGVKPQSVDMNKYYEISEIDKTYGQYLKERKNKFNKVDSFWDGLKGQTKQRTNKKARVPVSKVISKYSYEIIDNVSTETGYPKYIIKSMLKDVKRNVLSSNLKGCALSSKEIMSYHISKKANDFINEGRHLTRL